MINKHFFTFLVLSALFFSYIQNASAQINPVFSVTASFSPSTIQAGQSTAFLWQVSGPPNPFITCEVSNVPGLTTVEQSGAFPLTSTQDIFAVIVCSNGIDPDVFGFANLTVSDSVPSPLVVVTFTPATIDLGENSRLAWSAQNADSCILTRSDGLPIPPGFVSNDNTSGVSFITPINTGQLSVTAACSGPNETVTRTAVLTINGDDLPPPGVNLFYNPSFLPSPGATTLTWNSFNVTSCSIFGQGIVGVSGFITKFVFDDEQSFITCAGPGGVTTSAAQVVVGAPGIGRSVNEYSNTMSIADDLNIRNLPINSDTLIDKAALRALGVNLPRSELYSLAVDINADGSEDRLVLASDAQTLFVLISDNGAFTSLDKVISGITAFTQVESILVDTKGSITVTTTL